MTDNKTPSKDDVLRMAVWCDNHADLHDWKLSDIADMLRAYAEVVEVEVTDEDVEYACEAYQGPADWEFQFENVKENSRFAMRMSLECFRDRVLTAALSTRGG